MVVGLLSGRGTEGRLGQGGVDSSGNSLGSFLGFVLLQSMFSFDFPELKSLVKLRCLVQHVLVLTAKSCWVFVIFLEDFRPSILNPTRKPATPRIQEERRKRWVSNIVRDRQII